MRLSLGCGGECAASIRVCRPSPLFIIRLAVEPVNGGRGRVACGATRGAEDIAEPTGRCRETTEKTAPDGSIQL
jgi:hypothetical protein